MLHAIPVYRVLLTDGDVGDEIVSVPERYVPLLLQGLGPAAQ